MDLKAGLLVTRNVRLRRPLGEGGMGTVWVGDHLALDTQVAVKFISPELSQDDPEIFGRFQREAKIAARIKSQHVVQVFDHGVMEDGTPFIVMELLVGSSLAEWLALTGTLGPVDTAIMVSQVAGVLGKAHELGIVHRDIKPENVFLVDSEDRLFAKVLDFGIAKQTRVPKGSLKTGTGVLVGTPDYMSPEQLLLASEVDQRVDLWALAVVAYRALTGRCPFEGETVPAVIVAITDGSFPPPSSVSPQRLPPALDAWFARALSRDPDARFASARELGETFTAAVGAAEAVVGAVRSSPSDAPRAAAPAADGAKAVARAARAPKAAPPPAAKAQTGAPPLAKPKAGPPPGAAPQAAPPAPRVPKPAPPLAAAPNGAPHAAGARTVVALPATELQLLAHRAAPAEAPVAAQRRPPTRPERSDDARARTVPAKAAEAPERRAPPRKVQAAPAAKSAVAAGSAQPSARAKGADATGATPTKRSASPARARAALPVDLAEPVRPPASKPRVAEKDRVGATIAASTAAELAPVTLVVVAAAAVSFLLDTSGLQWLRAGSRGVGVGLCAASAVALALCCWRVAASAQRTASLLLWAGAAGLGTLAVGAGVAAGALQAPGGSSASLLPTVAQVAPIAGAVVATALGAFGLAHAIAELRGIGTGRHARGAVMILLSLAAVGLGYRIALRSPLLRDLIARSSHDSTGLILACAVTPANRPEEEAAPQLQ